MKTALGCATIAAGRMTDVPLGDRRPLGFLRMPKEANGKKDLAGGEVSHGKDRPS